MGIKRGWAIHLLLLLLPLMGYGQRYDFKRISVNEGLPHGEVHDIHQSEDRFIWIATNGGGLVRYDGHNFKTYTSQNGLRSNTIHRIFEDSKENLWIANEPGGVVTFQADSLVDPFSGSSLSDFEVWAMEEFDTGEIWFGTFQGGIFIWDGNDFRRLTTEDGLPSNSVWDIYKSSSGDIWVSTEEGIAVFDGGEITTYTTDDGLAGNRVYRVIEDQQGTFWMATNNGISTWDGARFTAITEINGTSLDYIFDVRQAADGDIWIGTETKGIFIYDGSGYTHLTRKNGLSSNYVYLLYEDRDHNMWIGTNENGISLYKGDAFRFYDEDFGLNSNAVLSLFFDHNNTLWIGTQEGIQSFDGKRLTSYSLPKPYENNYIREIAQLPDGDLLIVMPGNELMGFDGNQFYDFASDYEGSFISDVSIDNNDRIWIGTDEGLYILDDDTLTTYTAEDGLPGNVIQHINQVADTVYYISTTSGLSVFNGRGFNNITVEDGLNNNSVNYAVKGADKNIWVGTSGGVSVLQPENQSEDYSVKNFGRQEGMKLVATHFLWFDKQGYLWQGTNGGLNRLNVPRYNKTQSMSLVRYGLSGKELGVEFNPNAIAVDSAGNAWFGSMNGALKLDVDKLTYPQKAPIPNITRIEHNGKVIDWNNYTEQLNYSNGQLEYPSVTFPHGEHSYTFYFSGINYMNPQNIRYRFKVEGFEEEWMPMTSANTATYTNLEPGDYTFKVQALQGAEGDKSDLLTASYSFSVAYPFWQRSWFIGLMVVALVGMIYGYIRVRLGMLEKKRLKTLVDEQTKDLQEALEEKEVLIKEIHHRVKNNLAVISGLLELQMGHADNRFASRVLFESQRRVQSISMIHEKLYQNERLAEIDFEQYVHELVEIINYSFSSPAKDIEVKIDIDDFKLGVDQGIPCGLILNELVSNAYEHAFVNQQKGTIDIDIQEKDTNRIIFKVVDNGQGLPEDFDITQSETLGLTLVETLCKQVEGTFSFKNTENGTEFILKFKREAPPVKVPNK
ncbi:two-component regulator propeller domain-containing protein [Fodinibius sp. N2]|uniref:two-component regulator propeller domain-containing protein n=1 Tax=Fodinibius alkaliphilus TaxID=3140241 RepID=UPI00315A3248